MDFLESNGVKSLGFVQFNFSSIATGNASLVGEYMDRYLRAAPDIFILGTLASDYASIFLFYISRTYLIPAASIFLFNDHKPRVKAAYFVLPTSAYEQQLDSLKNIGDYWIGTTRWHASFTYGDSGVLGGTTAEFVEDFKASMGFAPALLEPVSRELIRFY